MTERRYRAFISYSHADDSVAVWLHRALESYRIPDHLVTKLGLASNRLLPIFRDRDELPTSDSLSATITAALRESEHLIVVCSPAAAQSRWVNQEIRDFRTLRPDGGVLCLLTDEPGSSLPPALVDTVGGEPLAADLRPTGDGRDDARLRIVAGLLGVGFDELKQREAQRRQRRLVIVAASALAGMTVAVGLAVLAFVSQQQAARAEQRAVAAAERANVEARTAERTLDFLTGILRESDPAQARGADTPVRVVLERAGARIGEALADEPLVRAQIQMSIGEVYDGLGLYAEAAELFEQAVETARREKGDEDPMTLAASNGLAAAWWRLGREDEAEPLLRRVLDARATRLGPEHADTLETRNLLANLEFTRGHFEAAEAGYRALWSTYARLHGDDDPLTLGARHNLANALESLERRDEAVGHFTHVLERRRAVQGVDHPDTLGAAANLASSLTQQGRLDEAEALERETLEIRLRVLGPEHPDTLMSSSNLALIDMDRGRLDAAAARLREVRDLRARILGADHSLTLTTRINLGLALTTLGDYAGARSELSAAVDGLTAKVGATHPLALKARTHLALAHAHAGEDAEAERLYRDALPDLRERLGPTHPDVQTALYNLACVAARQRAFERALDYLTALVASGFTGEGLDSDPDLRALHGMARFEAIVAAVREASR